MLICNFLAAGPTIAIVETTMDFYAGANPATNPGYFSSSVAKVSYFFTTTALLQGTGNFFWVPVANKFGRRPAYVLSYTIYTVRIRQPTAVEEYTRGMNILIFFRHVPFGFASTIRTGAFWRGELLWVLDLVRPKQLVRYALAQNVFPARDANK
jgi:MFS family permease